MGQITAMTTQEKIRSVRRKLAELMRTRERTSLVNPADPIERECCRLAMVLEKHQAQWAKEFAAIEAARIRNFPN